MIICASFHCVTHFLMFSYLCVGLFQTVKALWEYIKENNLQNPAKRSEILCDAKLRTLFPTNMVTMFSMNKYLSDHFIADE
jgi:chromatin remodeling complex protein RSC6